MSDATTELLPPEASEATALLAEQSEATALLDPSTALLIRARSFLERGWCREALARDRSGNGVCATDERAVMWCAVGALVAAGVDRGHVFDNPATRRLDAALSGEFIPSFNNRQESVEPVLAAFDRAIAAGAASGDRSVPDGHAIAMGDDSQEAAR